ncbi:MAG TPA: HEAT repeat domain-containing protein [Spirochaetota bacterium]|nr:HEAT repeat domain-containing protein [Spirochaetota bacterium]
MTDEKNFLQSIKLEISRNFKLDPYERIAFHKVLACAKSSTGRDILIREIEKGGDIRTSALNALSEFNDPSIVSVFTAILGKGASEEELLIILDFLYNNGSANEVPSLIEVLENRKNETEGAFIIKKIFHVLKKIGENDAAFHQYLRSIISNTESVPAMLEGAINAVSILKKPEIYEELIKRNNDHITYHVFLSIYNLNLLLIKDDEVEKDEYTPPVLNDEKGMSEEEELLLNIKVLLGKVTSKYEEFSVDTKNSYINAMLSCNHRESVIYAMKALESRNNELIRKTFFSIYNNITRLRFPEKLLRSLISMSVETEENNRLIVDIFTKYFSEKKKNRSDILFRDKLFGNITSTLEGYFETYRREFMIPDVSESSLPESFKKIRTAILKNLNPEQKRKLITDLSSDEKDLPRRILSYLSEWINFIDEDDQEAFSLLIDLIIDNDRVSRENTASRIDSVNFEKRYLQSRIVRLCDIINVLNIDGAAKSLVYIYNYLKKYPDKEIFDSAVCALCRINYSYMLSEVEIMLTAGSPEDQIRAVSLLPLFTEKRLINILVEYLKNNASSGNEVTRGIVSILSGQDIKSNINAIAVFKQVIENNQDPEIKRIAITGVGNCCITEDVEYLNELFPKVKEHHLKEAVVKAICSIIAYKSDFSKQQIMRFVQEYLKDPDIKVRIFSCMILIRLGNKDAFRSIREMLIIKNKLIQREILSILRDIRTPDFYFFLVSLLKEEFGISEDIIYLIRKLPVDELKEIETFIINIFRKFEIPSVGTGIVSKEIFKLENAEKKKLTVLYLTIENFDDLTAGMNFYELIEFYLKVDSIILKPVIDNSGVISDKDNSRITAWFSDPMDSIRGVNEIHKRLKSLNSTTVYKKNIHTRIVIVTDFFFMNGDEIFDYTREKLNINRSMALINKTVLDQETVKKISENFYSAPIPEILYSWELSDRTHFELMTPVNFKRITLGMLEKKEEEILKAKQEQAQIVAQIKNLKTGNRSMTSIAIAGELENIGVRLREQLEEIERYVNRRSTDRELSKNVRQMLNNAYNLYRVEISKLTIK